MDRQPFVLRLFARCLPADLREPIAGDLHEEYLEMRARHGAARAGHGVGHAPPRPAGPRDRTPDGCQPGRAARVGHRPHHDRVG